MFAARSLWLPPVIELAGPWAARRIGAELSVGRVRANGTSLLELEQLSLRPIPGRASRLGPIDRLEAERLSVQFSLWRLLSGDVTGIEWLDTEGLDLELDFATPREGAREEGGGGGTFHLPGLLARDSRLRISLPGGHVVEASGLALGVPQASDRRGRGWAGLTAEAFSYTGPDRRPIEGALASRLALDAHGVDIGELTLGEELRLREVRFAWGDREGLSWDGELEAFDGRAKLRGSSTRQELELEFDLEEIDLALLSRDVWPNLTTEVAGVAHRLKGNLVVPYAEPSTLSGEVQVDVGELALFGREPFDVEGRTRFGEGEARSGRIAVEQPGNAVVFEDVVLPLAAKRLGDLLRAGSARVSFDARDLPRLLGAETRAPEHRLELWATLARGQASIERGRLETPGGSLAVQGGTATARPEGGPALDLDLFADFEDLAPLAAIFDTLPWSGSLQGNIDLAGNWPALAGSARLEGTGVIAAGITLGTVDVELEGDERLIRVTKLLSRGERSELLLAGQIDLEERKLHDIEFRIDVEDLAELIPRSDTRGTLRMEGQARGRGGDLDGSWTLSAVDAVIGGRAIDGLTAAGTFAGDRALIESFLLESRSWRLELAGGLVLDDVFRPRRLALSALSVARGESELSLSDPTVISFAGKFVGVRNLVLAGSAGGVVLGVEVEDSLTRLNLRARTPDPMPLLGPLLPHGIEVAGLEGQLVLEKSADDLTFESSGKVSRLAFPLEELVGVEADHVWSGQWEASFADRVLRIMDLDLESDDGSHVKARGWLPLDPLSDPFLAEGDVVLWGLLDLPDIAELRRFVPPGRPWPEGSAVVDLDLSGTWRALTGTIEVEASGIDLDAGGEPLFREAEIAGKVVLGESVALEGVRVEVPGALSLQADGQLLDSFDVTRLIARERVFSDETELSLEAGLIVEDTTWLQRLNRTLKGDFLRRFGGRMAATLDLSGTLGNIRPVGQLELDGGQVKFSPELPSLENVSAFVEIDGGSYRITAMSGELGGSRFLVEGAVDLAEPTSLDISLVGENLLLYRAQGVKVRADTDLHVTGTPSKPLVSGTLHLQDSRFVRRFDFFSPGRRAAARPAGRALQIFSFREPPLSNAVFDVSVTNEVPFRIDNNVVNGFLRPDLRLVGTGETPEITGTIYVDEGKVALPAYDLFLRPGTITFDREDPMVPHLELVLGNRIRGYEVTVNVAGPWDSPEILMSSSPPLGEEDLFALVWTGQDPGEGLSSRAGIRGAQAVGFYLAKDLLTRFLSDESTESNESFLDRFELYLGRDTTQDGDETVEVTYRIADKVVSGRDTLYLATEQDEYAHINFGLRFLFRFE